MWKELKIESWHEFNDVISHLHYNEWIFRGQRNSVWDLQSSLYREVQKVIDQPTNTDCVMIENKMVNEFYSSSHLYSSLEFQVPSKENEKDWINFRLEPLSVMQDYGTPTRLLDWTRSPYIAAFFALDGAEDDFSIYALNVKELEQFDNNRYGDHFFNYKRAIFSPETITEIFIFRYDPYQKNERLRIQQGVFLVPSLINKTMDDILKVYNIKNSKLHGKEVTYKLVFNKENLQDYWYKLMQMNITHETIYPGLEGFCRSLKLHILL
ncbi:FRG domain-containing protein [Alkalihalobacterium alkalinitrilicum]|uniref:FRG domain-containing protein n=1 Tax=Alkalihalobacterium alkalinitrilicum TaxID=427920 RepID=UPI000995ABF9|nr:FRG domain-containing protein [Alkalihalobacterium alkalinitrilicum]